MLVGRLPVRRVRRAQAAGHLGPADGHGRRAAGRARRRRDQRRHDPGPRPVPGVPRGRGRARPGRRVGELDEEMVYELRAGMHGDVVVLGASSWRVAEISPNRVTVTPAPGVPGKLPFWKGDTVGRPIELGRAMGAFTRETEADLDEGPKGRVEGRRSGCGATTTSTPLAAENLLAYLEDEREATGVLPTDRRIVVERFRDELGDWRLVVLTPFGGRVHAPWTMALEARLAERLGLEVQTIWSDDGIAIRLPEGDGEPRRRRGAAVPRSRGGRGPGGRAGRPVEPVREPVPRERGAGAAPPEAPARARGPRCGSSASGRRTCSRSPRGTGASRSSSRRTASASPTCSTSPALREILDGVRRREIAVHSVETRARRRPSRARCCSTTSPPYMYEGDAPLAERRAQALTLDRDLLRELLGQEELRELLDAEALADLELSLQALVDERHAHDPDQVHDLLRRLGDLATDEVGRRTAGGRPEASLHLAELAASRRAVRARIGGEERWIAMEDVARYRDGVGVSAPPGVPQAFLGPAVGALDGLLARYARTHGPFLAGEPGAPLGPARRAWSRTRSTGWSPPGRLLSGRVPARRRRARVLRSRGPAAPPPPVAGEAAARGRARRPDHARPVPAGLAGRGAVAVGGGRAARAPLRGAERPRAPGRGRRPAGRPADPGLGPRARRAAGPRPRLPAAAARRAGRDGRGRLGRAGEPRPRRRPGRPATGPGRELLRPTGLPDGVERPADEIHERVRAHLRRRGASFYRELFTASGGRSDREVLDALWDLVWAGEVTNDTFAPLRALRWKRPAKDRRPRPGRLTSLGPPEAAGRWSLVERARRTTCPTRRRRSPGRSGSTRSRSRCSSATASSPARRSASEPIDGGFSRRLPGPARDGGGAAGSGAATSSTAWVPPSSRCPGAVDRLRAMRDQPGELAGERGRVVQLLAAADPANPYGAALAVAPARRRRPAAVPAGRRRVRGAGRRRGGPVPRSRRDLDPDAAGGRRSRGRSAPRSRPCATSSSTAGSASW